MNISNQYTPYLNLFDNREITTSELPNLPNTLDSAIKYDLNKPYQLPPLIGGSLFLSAADFINPCFKYLLFDDLINDLGPICNYINYKGRRIYSDPTTALKKIFVEQSQNTKCQGWIVQGNDEIWFINSETSLRFYNRAELQEVLYERVEAFLIDKRGALSYVVMDRSLGMTKRYDDYEMLMNRLYPQIEVNLPEDLKTKLNSHSYQKLLEYYPDLKKQILEKLELIFPSIESTHGEKIAYAFRSKHVIWQKGLHLKFFPLTLPCYDYIKKGNKPLQNCKKSLASSLLPSLVQMIKLAAPIFVFYSSLQLAWARACEQNNGNFHNNGPFELLEIIKEGQLLTSVTHHWLYVVPLEKSPLHDGVLMTNEKLGDDYFENRARFIDIQPDGEVKLGPNRTISSYRSGYPVKHLSLGTELNNGSYFEMYRTNHVSRLGMMNINLVNSENQVVKSCPSFLESIPVQRIRTLDKGKVVITEQAAQSLSTIFHLAICRTGIERGWGEEVYHLPEQDETAFFGYHRMFSNRISIMTTRGRAFSIYPSFIESGNIIESYVIQDNKMSNNVSLVAIVSSTQPSVPLRICSQPLDKNNNFNPMISKFPYCQKIEEIGRTIRAFTLKSASQEIWRGYLSLFEYQIGLRQLAHPVPTDLAFQFAPKSIFNSTPPVIINTPDWVNLGDSTPKAFIISSRKVSELFTLIWPEEGLKYRTYRLNPIFVKGEKTSEGVSFSALRGVLTDISIFHYPAIEGLKFNFTFLERRGLNDPDANYTFDWQKGAIKVFGQRSASLFFNASVCNEITFCASAKIRVNLIPTEDKVEKGSILPLFLIGSVVICIVGASSVCCIGLCAFSSRKVRTMRFLSHDYEDMELLPLLDHKENEHRNSTQISFIEDGKDHLDLDQLGEAKKCFLHALALDRKNIQAHSLLIEVVRKEILVRLKQGEFKQGLIGEAFLKNYKIKLKSIKFIENSKGKKEILGWGSFGTVYKAKFYTKQKTHTVALKKINSNELSKGMEDIKKEAEIMLRHNGHPNLVGLHGIIEEEGKYMLVVEFMSKGSLEDVLKNNKGHTWEEKYSFIVDIVRGLHYLHENDIVHRDLKPENILLNDKWVAKIADFGKARKVISMETTQIAGTPIFMDPWLQFGSYDNYDTYCDMYSFGMILWAIVHKTYTLPWKNVSSTFELEKIVMDQQQQEIIPDDCPEILKEIILSCWNKKHDQRPSAGQILQLLEKEKDQICNYQ